MRKFLESIAQYLVSRSKTEYSNRQLIFAILFGSSFELLIVPGILIVAGHWIDKMLDLSFLFSDSTSLALGIASFVIGVPWLAWSIVWQHSKGKGTPLPLVPTKILLANGPYRYMRNPMAFGGIFWLAGWTLLFESMTGLFGGVSFFAVSVLSWDYFIEEKELSKKHGTIYEEYRKNTPFLIPRFRSDRKGSGVRIP